MALSSLDQAKLRTAIFRELGWFVDARGGFATRDELVDFQIQGMRLGLVDRNRGIRNPQELDETLSVVSSLDGPYDDHVGSDGILRYSFREGDPLGGDNRKLRLAMERRTPIILFQKPMANVYVPIMPAYVVGEDRGARHFLVATDEAVRVAVESGSASEVEKSYVAQVVQRRVHQPVFRAQVIIAYAKTCAVCRLRHPELLDAAHIIPDADDAGVAHVTNGIALCKIHHAAYDNNMLGISPDYTVHIDGELLREVDGPMLKYGLQEMHGIELKLPLRRENWPSQDALATRFAEFS